MYKIGDKLVYILQNGNFKDNCNFEPKEFKCYTIKNIIGNPNTDCLLKFNELEHAYFSFRIITLLEYRKQKINKLKERINGNN